MTNLYSIKFSSRTEEQIKINTVLWTIPNFTSLLDDATNRELRTNKTNDFADNAEIDTKIQLKMQFVGRENDLIEIYYSAPIPMFLKSILTLSLKCYKERTLVKKDYQKIKPNKWQFLAVLYKRDLQSYDECDSYLNEGGLHMKFQFFINTGIKVDYSNVPKRELSMDMENLLNESMFSDVTIKSAEGIEFHAHKAVLATRCAVLKAHFEHNTMETMTNIIESPLETEVLQEVLTYIYTDNAPRVDEMPEKLLGAADFYQMSRLKSLCEDALYKKLTVENAIETLELADLHSALNLKVNTLEFINDGHAKLITKTKSWARVQSVPLIKSIFEFALNNGQLEADLR